MSYLRTFIEFWKDLLIGDDWTIAAGVVVMLAAAWVLVHAGAVPWLWLPLGVGAILTESLRRA